jgi:hypothetical protein
MKNPLILYLKMITQTLVSSMLLSLRASPFLLVKFVVSCLKHPHVMSILLILNTTSPSLILSLSLMDQGANGGAAGEEVRLILLNSRTVDIKGIYNHHFNNIGIGTVGGVVNT